ncbi:MAG TPA: hypothetical protein VMV49_04925 [Candidatus Deferrimicrobium sp.]|nr:hypothetical protein [Candidatus Deferrimicrobium sp.]
MRKKLVGLSSIFLVLLLSTFLMTGFGFSTTPTYIDTSLDQNVEYSCPIFTDMREIWIDHNTTFLRFKINLGGSWNQSGYAIYAHISINDATGSDLGELNFSADYTIALFPDQERIDLNDWVNNTNDLLESNNYGLAYYLFTNNKTTVEIGFKLQSYHNGVGYLNVSIGQTIKIQLMSGGDTDYAPNAGPLSFTLEAGGGIPGFSWLFLNCSVLVILALYLTKKRIIK